LYPLGNEFLIVTCEFRFTVSWALLESIFGLSTTRYEVGLTQSSSGNIILITLLDPNEFAGCIVNVNPVLTVLM
jgi:hypothetical protein